MKLTIAKRAIVDAIRAGYQRFKDEKHAAEVAAAAQKHGLVPEALQTFVDANLARMIFDGEQLTELLAPLDLGWRAPASASLSSATRRNGTTSLWRKFAKSNAANLRVAHAMIQSSLAARTRLFKPVTLFARTVGR